MKEKLVIAGAFVLTVYAANWALKHWGTVPVGFGYEAPAGVYFAGLGLLLRDRLNEIASRRWVLGAIVVGALLSYWVGASIVLPGGHLSLALASGLAFMVSESFDWVTYVLLRERTLPGAVGLSQVIGGLVDSILFLTLALGSLALLPGQLLGKTLMVLPIVLVMVAVPRWRRA